MSTPLIFAERDRDEDSVSWHFRRVNVDAELATEWERHQWRYMTTLADWINDFLDRYTECEPNRRSEVANSVAVMRLAERDPMVNAAYIIADAARSRIQRWILENEEEIGGINDMSCADLVTEDGYRARYEWRVLEEDARRGDTWNADYFTSTGYTSVLYC